ncbi:MAG: glucokinase [bacterium]
MADKSWQLVADIGGTNARFGLVDTESQALQVVKRYSVSQHRQFQDALVHFVGDIAALKTWSRLPAQACLAVACPPIGDSIRFTNSSWVIDRHQVSAFLEVDRLEIINDFSAIGYATTGLGEGDWHQIGGVAPLPKYPVAILGPGTGLGVCAVIPTGAGFEIVEGEGGHGDFAPIDAQEVAVFEILSARFGRVSAERLLSGAGILNIYQALATLSGKGAVHSDPSEITSAAIDGVDSLSVRTLQLFCRVLGATAGNLALTLGAKGGVYIAGGIVPRFVRFLEQSEFRNRFESKGRFRAYLADIPARVITKDDLGLHGAAIKLRLTVG